MPRSKKIDKEAEVYTSRDESEALSEVSKRGFVEGRSTAAIADWHLTNQPPRLLIAYEYQTNS